MRRIDIWPEAQEFLDSVSAKHKRQLAAKIFALAEDAFPQRSKQLEGYAPLRRIAAGDYRVIYFVDGNTLKIPLVDKRGDDRVYRRLKQLFG